MMAMPPPERLLLAAEMTLEAVDFVADAGVEGVTVRHSRHRNPNAEEVPCVSLIFVGDDDRNDDQFKNMSETVRVLDIDLQFDAPLETEDSGLDPTGWGCLLRFAAAALRALLDESSPLGMLCDDVIPRAIDPDRDDSDPDAGRLVRAITVLYRVRTDDPNELLARGVDGL